MIISYLGKECFKITQGDLTVVINPPSKDSKHSVSKFGANVSISTTRNKDFNGTELFSYGETIPFEIRGPGRYEVNGVEVIGAATTIERDGKKMLNTVYNISIDDINIGFLGPIQNPEISGDVRQVLGTPHILFVPIGGTDTIDAKQAAKVSVALDANITIPMDYEGKDELKQFLKEMGAENVKPEEKVTLKRRDIESKEGAVIVLEP